jgi:hypothetical protein
MKLWEIIVVAVVLFLVWGKMSKKLLPKSCISTAHPITPILSNCSSGDNFSGGKTTPVLAPIYKPMPVGRPGGCGFIHPITSPHVFFPVQQPLPGPIPVLRGGPSRPINVMQASAPAWCGNGPGWCTSKLDCLANRPAGMTSGCGAF